MLKKIHTFIGIAASGKSTESEKLIRKRLMEDFEVPMPSNYVDPTKYFNADDIRKELYGDPTIQGDPMKVFGVLFDRYTQALKDNTTDLIIIDNTSLTYKIRKRYYQLAQTICPMFDHKFEYHLVYFEPDLERSLKWNKQRDRQVPEDVIKRQFETIKEPTEKELEYAIVTRIK